MAGDTLHQPLGSASRADLSFTVQQLASLRHIVSHFLPEEQRHWEENGEPFEHVYHDLVAVRWVLREYDNQQELSQRADAALAELATRLSQG